MPELRPGRSYKELISVWSAARQAGRRRRRADHGAWSRLRPGSTLDRSHRRCRRPSGRRGRCACVKTLGVQRRGYCLCSCRRDSGGWCNFAEEAGQVRPYALCGRLISRLLHRKNDGEAHPPTLDAQRGCVSRRRDCRAALLKSTSAQPSALRIGVPTAITGNWALPAVQIQRTCRLYAKYINSRGGIDGRQINFVQAKLVRSQRMRTGLWVLSSPRFRVAPLPQYATAKSTRSVSPACVLRIACIPRFHR